MFLCFVLQAVGSGVVTGTQAVGSGVVSAAESVGSGRCTHNSE